MNSRISIIGAGESGTGAAYLAKQKGFQVFVSDNKTIKENYKTVLSQAEIEFEEGNHSFARIAEADLAIVSPGVPESAAVVKMMLEKGIPVIDELEFAFRYNTAKIIGITGSNGKTTTTALIWHILKNGGINAGIGGNYGVSFAMQLATQQYDWYVLEISSFQLDRMCEFKADIAILTNITPDHLDRYDYNFENYVRSKFRILQNQTKDDAFIYCADDETTMQYLPGFEIKAQQFPFSFFNEIPENGAYVKDKTLIINTHNTTFDMTLEELALQGRHNVYNSMAAGVAGRLIDIRKESIRQSLSDFQNLEHRLEYVGQVHGVKFINDSKATNVNSTWFALESIDTPVIWIAGGIDKGNDYTKLTEMVAKKVKAIVCLGVDNSRIIEAFKNVVPVILESRNAEQCVLQANMLSKQGDTVLLSPACASFDLFENYEDRGNQFKKAVLSL
jgi:UDP-N-acetylmuramoylalanine--D-glutamate ligase